MPAKTGMAVAIAAYAGTALVAGALAAGGPRDRATASSGPAGEAAQATAERRGRFPSLSALLYSRSSLSTARSLLALSGFTARIERSRQWHTLLLPVDRAFSDQQGVTDALARPGNETALRRAMRFHVIVGRHGLYAGTDLPTLGAERVAIRSDGRRWWAQDAAIIGGPLRFPHGTAYLVDEILVAPGEELPVNSSTISVAATAP